MYTIPMASDDSSHHFIWHWIYFPIYVTSPHSEVQFLSYSGDMEPIHNIIISIHETYILEQYVITNLGKAITQPAFSLTYTTFMQQLSVRPTILWRVNQTQRKI